MYCQTRRSKAQRIEPYTEPAGSVERDNVVLAGARALQEVEHEEFDFYVKVADPAQVLDLRE